MKVLILAGGYGTRLSEETGVKPKPMVEIGEQPILWHIMKIYSHHGFRDFVILCGYKGQVIKDYFANYFIHNSDVTFDLANNEMKVVRRAGEDWRVTMLDTGATSMTGGRVKRAQSIVGNEPFHLTYGDGVSDVDIGKLLEFHKKQKSTITLSAVQPVGRFGVLEASGNQVTAFREKPQGENSLINAGFMVCEPELFDHIHDGDATVFERATLVELAALGRLSCYRHPGFWKCMDTLADKIELNKMWEQGEAPWKVWP